MKKECAENNVVLWYVAEIQTSKLATRKYPHPHLLVFIKKKVKVILSLNQISPKIISNIVMFFIPILKTFSTSYF